MTAEHLMHLINALSEEEQSSLLDAAKELYETATNVPAPGKAGPVVRSAVSTYHATKPVLFGTYAGDVPLDSVELPRPPEDDEG